MTTITYRDSSPNIEVSVRLGWRATERQEGDVCLSRSLAVDCPLKIAALVRLDGSVAEWYADWYTKWGPQGSTTWNLDHGSDDDAVGRLKAPKPLSGPQRETLIRIWGGQINPFGVGGSAGAPVMCWINPTDREIVSILGARPYLTAPCDDRQEVLR